MTLNSRCQGVVRTPYLAPWGPGWSCGDQSSARRRSSSSQCPDPRWNRWWSSAADSCPGGPASSGSSQAGKHAKNSNKELYRLKLTILMTYIIYRWPPKRPLHPLTSWHQNYGGQGCSTRGISDGYRDCGQRSTGTLIYKSDLSN